METRPDISAAKQKGTAFESSVLTHLRHYYPEADRSPLHGNKDTGDFLLPGERRFILEAKNVKQMNLAGWLAEAIDEAWNAAVKWGRAFRPAAVVVHKRRGKADPAEQYVTLTLEDFLRLVNE